MLEHYPDQADAPSSWEVLNITCAQGAAPPPTTRPLSDTIGGDNERGVLELDASKSQCHWAREINQTGGLLDAMQLQLTGSGSLVKVSAAWATVSSASAPLVRVWAKVSVRVRG